MIAPAARARHSRTRILGEGNGREAQAEVGRCVCGSGAVKALLSRAPGGPATLALAELPDPVAGPGELLVAVKAYCDHIEDLRPVGELLGD